MLFHNVLWHFLYAHMLFFYIYIYSKWNLLLEYIISFYLFSPVLDKRCKKWNWFSWIDVKLKFNYFVKITILRVFIYFMRIYDTTFHLIIFIETFILYLKSCQMKELHNWPTFVFSLDRKDDNKNRYILASATYNVVRHCLKLPSTSIPLFAVSCNTL